MREDRWTNGKAQRILERTINIKRDSTRFRIKAEFIWSLITPTRKKIIKQAFKDETFEQSNPTKCLIGIGLPPLSKIFIGKVKNHLQFSKVHQVYLDVYHCKDLQGNFDEYKKGQEIIRKVVFK